MQGLSAWDNAKRSENSCSSDKKELTFSYKREFPKKTCFGMSGLNSGCSRRGSVILGAAVAIWSTCHPSYV